MKIDRPLFTQFILSVCNAYFDLVLFKILSANDDSFVIAATMAASDDIDRKINKWLGPNTVAQVFKYVSFFWMDHSPPLPDNQVHFFAENWSLPIDGQILSPMSQRKMGS